MGDAESPRLDLYVVIPTDFEHRRTPGCLDTLLIYSLESELFHDSRTRDRLESTYFFIISDPVPVSSEGKCIQKSR